MHSSAFHSKLNRLFNDTGCFVENCGDKLNVVALVALAEELEEFRKVFPHVRDVSQSNQICLEHESGCDGIRLISVLSEEMGSQSAARSAKVAVDNFCPDLIVVVGIAGGVSSDVNISDVVVSNEILDVIQNTKISEKDGASDISFSPDFYNVNAELVASFAFLKSHPDLRKLYDDWRVQAACDSADAGLTESGDEPPELHIGPLACGPVSASEKFNKKLRDLSRKVLAIETESGGVFNAISEYQIPAIAIRGISDLADETKAELERVTKGRAREIAMRNAANILRRQFENDRFLNVARRFAAKRNSGQAQLFPAQAVQVSVVATLEEEIRARLREFSPEFKNRPNDFYLPVPRVRKILYAEELGGRDLEDPENLIDSLSENDRLLVRLPRTFPTQGLGWSIAYSLLRQQIDGKVILPIHVDGSAIRPPKSGLVAAVPAAIRAQAFGPEFIQVFIIEEPEFESRNRIKFLTNEISNTGSKILVLTKAEDIVGTIEEFRRSSDLREFELSPISFSETALFLEKAFDMSPREAEIVAIRLDDTFRKFRLDAHPTYFAGLQEETLAALINANKRAELIQLAVDGLLLLIVAADKAKLNLSRTTRERFLKRLVVAMIEEEAMDNGRLSSIAIGFLEEYKFDVPQAEFLEPFFRAGLLYHVGGVVRFTHPYLESYLLAQALRDDSELAGNYFDPANQFSLYAFDLYCEMGPDEGVIRRIKDEASNALERARREYPRGHIFLERKTGLATISTPAQIASLRQSLDARAKRLERNPSNEDVRGEKQRMLDARKHAREEVSSREPRRSENLPSEIREEFEVLDGLSRALALAATAVGSGSESLSGNLKVELSNLVVHVAGKFSDVWTRNRLRTDYTEVRKDLLSDEKIWEYIEDNGHEEAAFQEVKKDLEVYLHGLEVNSIVEPMSRVLNTICSTAGVRVLSAVLKEVSPGDNVEAVIAAAWMLEVDPKAGKDALKAAMGDYDGSSLFRVLLASHLLWRVFWHHFKTPGAAHFLSSATRVLAPLGLIPAPKRVEQAKKGPLA